MEEQPLSITELQVDESARVSLRDTAKWTRFIAIFTYVLMGLILLSVVLMLVYKDSLSEAFNNDPELSKLDGLGINVLLSVIVFAVIVVLAIVAVVNYILLRFSTRTARGIDGQDQVALETGMVSLKTYMIINGVFAIIGITGGLFNLIAAFL